MKSILVDDFLAQNVNATQGHFRAKDENGNPIKGWAIAKPLNYDKEYLSKEYRKAMAQEVLDGHAIAIHFTEDEIDLGEVPTLFRRSRERKLDKCEKRESFSVIRYVMRLLELQRNEDKNGKES